MDRVWLASVFVLLLAGCAARQPVAPSSDITVGRAVREHLVGEQVRWGGDIANVTRRKDESCFEVISRPLRAEGQPLDVDQSDGRFVTCVPGFYDPAMYARRRTLTVIGTLQQPVVTKIGDAEIRYPRVAPRELYLWREDPPASTWLNRYWPRFWLPWAQNSPADYWTY